MLPASTDTGRLATASAAYRERDHCGKESWKIPQPMASGDIIGSGSAMSETKYLKGYAQEVVDQGVYDG